MKKFSKVYEYSQNFKKYKVSTTLDIIVEADSEGEAGYLSDSILGGISEQIDFKINNIAEITSEEFKKLTENMEQKSSDWEEKNDKLVKVYNCKDFKHSIKFINLIADVANATDHHPEINNIYDKVTIKLSTHSAGNKVTDKDKRLAQKIDALWNQM